MEVRLIEHTKLSNACIAGRTCWGSFHKGGCYNSPTDVISDTDREFLERIINKNKHKSISEHLVYTFDIDGISRACLQELARHRMASLSVQSSRYTLSKILKDGVQDAYVTTGITQLDEKIEDALLTIANSSISNDKLKYMLPEALKTSLVWTINARSLQNFLELRSSKHALWEMQDLAKAVYEALPLNHIYLFSHCFSKN